MKNIFIGVGVVVLIILGIYFVMPKSDDLDIRTDYENVVVENLIPEEVEVVVEETGPESVIGQSVSGNGIKAYSYGEGKEEILFVGGIHGGYAWNTSLLAYEVIDYLEAHPEIIPTNLKVTVIPVLNPDGLKTTTGKTERFTIQDVPIQESSLVAGRFNANGVDLNRNFDCDWQSTGTWKNTAVSGGNSVFSEPEALAIKDYITNKKPAAVVVWYSAAGGVYASSCHNGVLAETQNITKAYASASGYTSNVQFDSYEITGDMVNWLASKEIPAISVLLKNHTDIDWEENKNGIETLLQYYSK